MPPRRGLGRALSLGGRRRRGPAPRSLHCPMRSSERAEPRLYFLGKEPRPPAYSPRPSSGYSRSFGSRSVRSGESAECLCRDPADLRSSMLARQAGVRRARSRSRQSPRRPHAPAPRALGRSRRRLAQAENDHILPLQTNNTRTIGMESTILVWWSSHRRALLLLEFLTSYPVAHCCKRTSCVPPISRLRNLSSVAVCF
jgi:hypothetical protein